MSGIPRETLEATLPSGKKIKLRELDGNDEMLASKEAGDNRQLVVLGEVKRSLVAIGGAEFDQSEHTAETTRALFSTKEWQLVILAFSSLNRPSNEEATAFEATFRRSAEGAGD